MTDIERSIRFYCDVLGATLARIPDAGNNPAFTGRKALVMLGPIGLNLYEHAGNNGVRFHPSQTGLDHLALIAESADHLHAWAGWLDSQDIPHSHVRDGGGVGKMFDFVDPDGIQIEFFFLDQEKLRSSTAYNPITERRPEHDSSGPSPTAGSPSATA